MCLRQGEGNFLTEIQKHFIVNRSSVENKLVIIGLPIKKNQSQISHRFHFLIEFSILLTIFWVGVIRYSCSVLIISKDTLLLMRDNKIGNLFILKGLILLSIPLYENLMIVVIY